MAPSTLHEKNKVREQTKATELCLEKGFKAGFQFGRTEVSLQHGICTLKKPHLHDHATKPPPWLLQKDPGWDICNFRKGVYSQK